MLSATFFIYKDVRSISISNLNVRIFCFLELELRIRVKRLILTGNELLNLNAFLGCLNVSRLEAGGNKIQFLTEEEFKSAGYIFLLKLSENQIRRIDTNTFQRIRLYLEDLDLSSNKIASINGTVRNSTSLKQLNLSNNLLKVNFLFINLFIFK